MFRKRPLDRRRRAPLAGACGDARGRHGSRGHRLPAVFVRRRPVHPLRHRAPLPETDSGRENPRPHPLPDLRPAGDGRVHRQYRRPHGPLDGLRGVALRPADGGGVLPRMERLPRRAQGRQMAPERGHHPAARPRHHLPHRQRRLHTGPLVGHPRAHRLGLPVRGRGLAPVPETDRRLVHRLARAHRPEPPDYRNAQRRNAGGSSCTPPFPWAC